MKDLFHGDKKLYLITDRAVSGAAHAEAAARALKAGAGVIQLREKGLTKKYVYEEALNVRALTLRYRALFIVNDHIDIALAVNADGVHLGQDDMPVKEARKVLGRKKIIGISTRSPAQAVRAQRGGADYIGFGPVYHTTTKDAGRPRGIRALRAVTSGVSIPVVAIGGITLENIAEIFRAGANAAAISSAILSGDISLRTKDLLAAVRNHV